MAHATNNVMRLLTAVTDRTVGVLTALASVGATGWWGWRCCPPKYARREFGCEPKRREELEEVVDARENVTELFPLWEHSRNTLRWLRSNQWNELFLLQLWWVFSQTMCPCNAHQRKSRTWNYHWHSRHAAEQSKVLP